MKTMTTVFKLATRSIVSGRKRSILTFIGVTMSVSLIALVCGIAFAAVSAVMRGDFEPEAVEAVPMMAKGFTIATVIMSCLMIYAAFSVSFDGRVKTIGLLSCVGMSAGQKSLMILAESMLYGIVGSVCGVILGLTAARLFYGLSVDIIFGGGTSVPAFTVTLDCVLLSVAAGILSTIAASFVPMLKIHRISIMDSIHGRMKVNISLKQSLVSRVTELCFGKIGKLAGQNYDNHKSKYRAISLALSGGTIFFFAIYCFFMYPIRYDAERGYPRNEMIYSLFYTSSILAALFILIFLICASGSAAVNIDHRKREFAMLRSIGVQSGELCAMMCIESIYLVFYSALYGFAGSLLADYLICRFFRITDEPMLEFWYPVPVFLVFVLFYILVGLLFAVYSVFRVRGINIIEAIKNKI